MCTLSLWRGPGADDYALVFNRDEKHARAPETIPTIETSPDGTRYLAPRDTQGGGTWILANERGLVLCVTNDYAAASPKASPGRLSRGKLPIAACSATTPRQAVHIVQGILSPGDGLHGCAPFYFFAFARSGDSRCLHWDGANARETGAPDFHTTSSFDPARVIRARHEAHASLAREGRTLEALRALHWSHREDARAESLRMWRPDACTRSITEVLVSGNTVSMSHRPVDWRTPEGRGPATEIRL